MDAAMRIARRRPGGCGASTPRVACGGGLDGRPPSNLGPTSMDLVGTSPRSQPERRGGRTAASSPTDYGTCSVPPPGGRHAAPQEPLRDPHRQPCDCRPTYQAQVYSPRDRKTLPAESQRKPRHSAGTSRKSQRQPWWMLSSRRRIAVTRSRAVMAHSSLTLPHSGSERARRGRPSRSRLA